MRVVVVIYNLHQTICTHNRITSNHTPQLQQQSPPNESHTPHDSSLQDGTERNPVQQTTFREQAPLTGALTTYHKRVLNS